MDVKLTFTAVDSSGALASAASDKLEGVMQVIVLGRKAWMFSSEDINKTTIVSVDMFAEDRADHELMTEGEDAQWRKIQQAVAQFGGALVDAQADRLKMVNAEEQRAHQQAEQAAAGSLDRFVKQPAPVPEDGDEEPVALDTAPPAVDTPGVGEVDPAKPAGMDLPSGQELMDDVTKPAKKARKK
jgi:hypothetical protein